MKPELLILGSVALDTIETPSGKIRDLIGGSATYAAYAASLFVPCAILSTIGDDFPSAALKEFEKRKIFLKGLQVKKGEKSFRWEAWYEQDLNEAKTRRTELNVLEKFQAKIPLAYRSIGYVFLGNNDPQSQLAVLRQLSSPAFIAADTMNIWIREKRDILLQVIKKVNLFLLNEAEARQLSGIPNLVKTGKKILEMGPQAVIIKKGEHGALLFTPETCFSLPGYPLQQIVDPTGCGDSFGGGLCGYLACTGDVREKGIRKAMVYASVIASYTAEDFGIKMLKKIGKKELEKRYKEFVKLREF